ncbi:MAG TPA: alpha-L-fucosidase, partial [Flavisolibacter sp.]
MVTMNKLLFFFLFIFLLFSGQTIAQVKKSITNETPAHKAERLEWFKDARFGMFIHWGLYALPARHEWVKNRERMTNEAYQKYFDNFNPDQF